MTEEARHLSMDVSQVVNKVLIDAAERALKDPMASSPLLNRRQLLWVYLNHFRDALNHEMRNMEVPT